MAGREDEPGERVTTDGAAPTTGRPAGEGAAAPGTTTPDAAPPTTSATTSGPRTEEDLAAETTHQVDTAGAARGDVRRPAAEPGRDAPGAPSSRPAPGSDGATETGSGEAGPEGAAGPSPTPGPSTEVATVGAPTGPPALSDLSSAQLLRPARPVPRTGWRRAVYVASGGVVNPGESEADAARRALVARVNQPLQGCYKIAMLSLKGGVGKTTTTAALGATFASLRGDRVVAVDANPDRGTLAEKVPVETTATVRHLLRDAALVRRYSDVRAYTSQGPSRLEVLASEQDPAVSEAFSELDYRRAVDLLEHFYNIVLTDCGTGLMHSAMRGVLDVADSLVVVSSSSIDGARSASATLDWLDAHGYGDLVTRSTAVINYVRRSSGGVDLDRVAEHFAARCRTVARLPFDPHLDEGAEIELEKLAPRTRTAMLELAAVVADDFPRVGSRVRIGPR
ncbi:MinD/ParA family protein [Actinomycetospora sp. TBRC 11914]|uniref:MinD/ParA family ATP-binding protein n=1 Tax=Actinomycetospora sp. TBRC 11914 TaxID=2729387 RepID=UPI00145E129E|nr:MinD/ParA family protein [Actinomycetospora sp. TBRC 11914]NMO91869.1 AAA family ATPase [Actinomycetospora sp. TBRC 11914]